MRYSSLISIFPGASLIAAAPAQVGKRGGSLKRHSGGQGGQHEYGGTGEPASVAKHRAAAVKEAFEFAWDGYYKYAFPNDELLPVDNSFSNARNGWGASAADALSTALVMEIPENVNEILGYVPTIDWSVSYDNEQVSLFKTTVRYLGGLLSGYDILSGPLTHLADNKANVAAHLDQAQNLANNISYAFDTPTGIRTTTCISMTGVLMALIPMAWQRSETLVLEWTHLSDLTGDETYGALAQKGESYLHNPQPAWAEPWPGLVGTNVNITTGLFEGANGGWNGGDDSFYEYLIKMYVYDSSRFSSYKDRWVLAADSTIAHLASHPSSRPNLTFLAQFQNTTLDLESGHLACFDGGNSILGGLVLGEDKYVDFGLQLVEACEDTYNRTLTGVGPEGFSWNVSALPGNQTAFYEQAGFYITHSHYRLRPEVIESFYYAYRVTGSRVYQDWAWNAFKAINATTRDGPGFSEITDVNAPNGGSFANFQDSFLFAEVLKYSYLIHVPDAEWQVNHDGVNEFVFNTEAHPFKVAGTPI